MTVLNRALGAALAAGTILGASGSAFATGWDVQGLNSYDLLFSNDKFVIQGQTSYVDRNVDFKNVEASGGLTGSVDNTIPDVWLHSVAVKANLFDGIDFFAKIDNPYIIREKPGFEWAGRYALGETVADSVGIDGMLSYKYDINDSSNIRLFGGVRSVKVSYEQNSALQTPLGDTTSGVDVESDREFGWRIGAAYEIPELALRAKVSYDSEIDLDLDGDFVLGGNRLSSAAASATLPQAVEASIQSGVAPGWLVSLGVKWVDWSVLNELSVGFSGGPASLPGGSPFPQGTTRVLNYSDGWTVEAGVSHKLTDKLGVGGTVTWDQGIGGPYSDFWAFGLGGSYDVSDNVRLALGGRAVYKTADSGIYQNVDPASGTVTSEAAYDYDSSWNFQLSSRLRVSF
ncbi:OmpP1/FadL family transporter [Pseudovibrio exalbescens]|uniref:OmpP1/FadL family transporter n=1 Tax=Pseudovibrio exalbescens TaxID=197461 RepID=UPI000C9CFBA8|nr:outer membrane protein transport protein [Pseudovibrio exalbescens]